MNVLILYNDEAYRVGTVKAHLDAFVDYSVHKVFLVDCQLASQVIEDINFFDIVVFHYSIRIGQGDYKLNNFDHHLRQHKGYKVLYIQDEYRWIDKTALAIAELDIDVIYTVLNDDIIGKVYHHPEISHVRRKQTLTGFVPTELNDAVVPSYAERPIDVGYRVRRVPFWLGVFGQEKWLLGVRFKENPKTANLKLDIEHSEDKRLYGEAWISFVSSCKAMLGAESKISYFDFSDTVREQVDDYVLQNPDVSFEEVRDLFLEGDGDILCHVISPRCFEAAALRTLMILYPGDYSGALVPWRHYVPLEFDHSNLDEVLAVLKDEKRAQEIIDCAYEEVALNEKWSFKGMVAQFDEDLADYQHEIELRRECVGMFDPSYANRLHKKLDPLLKRQRYKIAAKARVRKMLSCVFSKSVEEKLIVVLKKIARI